MHIKVNQDTDPFKDPIVETNVSATRGGRDESGGWVPLRKTRPQTWELPR
ncbi:putative zinc finger cchc-type protein [Erysiphe neolycopersici]|uniref:Putative zinc finger cchc-type protein n=1 Tax=Erysiphe neolycopersici TaxID=212602 RepID=A0A420I5G0_9PEZI|nr:putative zinc finger cchc-type protein [Erysiphe neolycopersici]